LNLLSSEGRAMEKPAENPGNGCRNNGVLLWDLAGTLVPFDPVTGVPGPLPGSDEFLQELGQKFRMVVTTGESLDNARNMLSGYGLAGNFEKIFGDLFCPIGKPYGEILRKMDADPACSLSVGDRLRSDVASDTDQIVSLLINQGDDRVTAGLVDMVIRLLLRKAATFPEAFRKLCGEAAAADDLLGERAGGSITACWSVDMGFPCKLLIFDHPVLDGDRMIIQI